MCVSTEKVPVCGFNQDQVKVVFYRALYPFDARSHDEITITPGDIVMVRHTETIELCVCEKERERESTNSTCLSPPAFLYLKVKGEWVSAGPTHCPSSNQLSTFISTRARPIYRRADIIGRY